MSILLCTSWLLLSTLASLMAGINAVESDWVKAGEKQQRNGIPGQQAELLGCHFHTDPEQHQAFRNDERQKRVVQGMDEAAARHRQADAQQVS
ncbi:hypothetical protein VQ056_27295 [Paenibacillus sp. JTLBN-2024]